MNVRVLAPRTHGAAAWVTTAVRIVTGALFITFSLGKFFDHGKESADFDHYGIPAPEVATYLAIATAGRVDGGTFHLGVGPAMMLAMLYLVWPAAGAWPWIAGSHRRAT